ncbi:MAG TPA: hypothetical protein DDY75_17045 [Sphingobacterium sp.]|nr:hypothetical protein [Sphingobacterium sp.]
MGPGFESQRDHKRKANRKISFFCFKAIRIRKKVRPGSILSGLSNIKNGPSRLLGGISKIS